MAFYSEASFKRGTKDTSLEISQGKPLEIGEKIWMLHPNRNQGLRWALRTGRRVNTPRVTFGHNETVPNPQWVTYNGANETSQGTTGLVFKTGHGTRLTTGFRIFFPRIKEIIRLTAVMSTDTTGTVTRNFGLGNATTSLLKVGDKGLLLTPVFEEGFTIGLGLTSSQVNRSFPVEEVDWPIALSHKEAAEASYAGDPFVRAVENSIQQSKDQMEATMYFGAKATTTVGGIPITAAEGCANFVQTNVYSATYLSRMDLWDIIGEILSRSPEGFSIHCSWAFKNLITGWGLNSVVTTPDTTVDGLSITTLRTPNGDFPLQVIDLFGQEPTLMGTVMFIPYGKIDYRPLVYYEDWDIRYYPIPKVKTMAKEGHIYGIYGWEYFEQETWGKLEGLRFAA